MSTSEQGVAITMFLHRGAGWFAFGIEKNKIHIVTARTDSYFVFDNGALVYSIDGVGYDRLQELQNQYKMTDSVCF